MAKEMSEENVKKALDEGTKKGMKIVGDPTQLGNFVGSLNNLDKFADKIGDAFADLSLLVEIVKAYYHKEYTEIPVGTIAAIIGAILYVINPQDIIPDYIIGVGYIDDLAVIYLCYKLIDKDIQKYKEWKNGQTIAAEAEEVNKETDN